MTLDHQEGFEKEALYHEALGTVLREQPAFKNPLLMDVVRRLCPDFAQGLFERRPCVRNLRYLGCHWCGEETEVQPGDDDLSVGQLYESETFNGATYTLKSRSRPIGCAYFERLT